MKKILVSECLYGDRIVRYDGREKTMTHPLFLQWKEEGRLVPVCPEVIGGLKVPRIDGQRKGDRVFTRDGEDVTAQYAKGAEEALRIAEEQDVLFCIMKEYSPSCGSNIIYDGSFSGDKVPGQGIATEVLRKGGFKVFSDEEIDKAAEYLANAEAGEERR